MSKRKRIEPRPVYARVTAPECEPDYWVFIDAAERRKVVGPQTARIVYFNDVDLTLVQRLDAHMGGKWPKDHLRMLMGRPEDFATRPRGRA